MSSIARRIEKGILKSMNKWDSRDQPTRDLPDGGYETLHPTKGWVRVSGARVRARERMANRFGFIR